MLTIVIIIAVVFILVAITNYANQTTAISANNRQQFVIDTPISPSSYLQDDKFKYAVFQVNGTKYASITGVILFDIPASFTLPSSVSDIPIKKIGKEAFKGLNLNEIILSNTIEEIGDSAFNSTNLKKINIPFNIKRIGNSAFANCYQLEINEIRVYSTTLIETNAFKSVKIRTLSIDDPSKCFPRAFAYANIQKVHFEKAIYSLPKELFAYAALSSIKLPAGITEIPEKCFYSSKLKKILIPSSVRSVATKAFMQCIDTTPRRLDGQRDLRYNTTTADIKMNITIYCEAGSFAQSYARENGFEARPLSEYTE